MCDEGLPGEDTSPGCVTRMQEDLGWDTLFIQKRRLDNRPSMLYKIDHQLVDVKKENNLQSGDSRTRIGIFARSTIPHFDLSHLTL